MCGMRKLGHQMICIQAHALDSVLLFLRSVTGRKRKLIKVFCVNVLQDVRVLAFDPGVIIALNCGVFTFQTLFSAKIGIIVMNRHVIKRLWLLVSLFSGRVLQWEQLQKPLLLVFLHFLYYYVYSLRQPYVYCCNFFVLLIFVIMLIRFSKVIPLRIVECLSEQIRQPLVELLKKVLLPEHLLHISKMFDLIFGWLVKLTFKLCLVLDVPQVLLDCFAV